MIVYISGPITGHEDTYKADFVRAKQRLQHKGYKVINPAELDRVLPVECMDKEAILSVCLHLMRNANAIYLIKGWCNSAGCRLELKYALSNDFAILEE